ncbi:MAG: phosphate ABC transporter permease PstA [Bacteroidia bacterium]|nr:phosphate ABC transporter permease PstA [Bacteroidia bacterium]
MALSATTHQRIFFGLLRALTLLVVLVLLAIVAYLLVSGFRVLSWEFFTAMPKEGMTAGGILPAIVGTLLLTFISIGVAFPVGLLSGIFIAEYAPKGRLKRFVDLMTNNLAGIPSIVFGLFGMTVFVVLFGFGDSIVAGSLTLAILVLPVIIRTTDEALQSVSHDIRLGSIGLGATKLQTIFRVVLPVAFPRILTGLILSMGRVAGETAPILFTVAAYFLPRLPSSAFDQVMALPYHLYVISTSGTNLEQSRPMANGTALVLLLLILILNLSATFLRRRAERHSR